MPQQLGGNTARPAGPNGPKGYPVPCEVVLSNKARGKFARAAVAQKLAGNQFAGVEQFRFTLLVFLGFVSLCVFSLLFYFFTC